MNAKIYSSFVFLFLNLFAFSFVGEGQTIQNQSAEKLTNPFVIYQKGLEENNYLQPLIELRRNEAEYMKSEQWRGLVTDLLGYLHSFAGEYETAYPFLDRHFEKQIGLLPDLQNSPLNDYKPRNALDAIASVAAERRVIMINEEHDAPLHRAFTARLLPVLYKKGFRYLAAETLSEEDTNLNVRGYPVHKTGFYSNDPVFGDMLRSALKLGFKLVPYEHKPKQRCVSPSDNPDFCQNERERGQAQNLYDRIFKNDPQAKVLVHVGRGHNQKLKIGDLAMMGWHFRAISRIEPFSVNQMMSERSAQKYERPEYRYVTAKWKFSEPTAFQSAAGEWWKSDDYDLIVYHPRSLYRKGRPVWTLTGGLKKLFSINPKKLKLAAENKRFTGRKPILVQAITQGESADTVPADQIILHPDKEIAALVLPNGKFRIRAIDESGKVIGEYQK